MTKSRENSFIKRDCSHSEMQIFMQDITAKLEGLVNRMNCYEKKNHQLRERFEREGTLNAEKT